GEIERLARRDQALAMRAGLEDLPAIGALALEHAARIVKPMRQHVNLGILPGHEFAVKPDPAVALVHRDASHCTSPCSRCAWHLCCQRSCITLFPLANRNGFGISQQCGRNGSTMPPSKINVNKADINTPVDLPALPLDVMGLFFFAYRDFVGAADALLARQGFGRARHRVLYFVTLKPGMPVADLLRILKITKQSLARVLRQLIDSKYIEQRPGE